jgi:hypothetical protein
MVQQIIHIGRCLVHLLQHLYEAVLEGDCGQSGGSDQCTPSAVTGPVSGFGNELRRSISMDKKGRWQPVRNIG